MDGTSSGPNPAEVARLYLEGTTIGGIAAKTGRSRSTIWRILHHQNVTLRGRIGTPKSRLYADRAAELYTAGQSGRSLAAALHISEQTARHALKHAGMGDTLPRSGPSAASLKNLETSNANRCAAAAARTVARAHAALTDPIISVLYGHVLRARVDHPHLTLGEIAAAVGMTKDKYAALLRRALTYPRTPQP